MFCPFTPQLTLGALCCRSHTRARCFVRLPPAHAGALCCRSHKRARCFVRLPPSSRWGLYAVARTRELYTCLRGAPGHAGGFMLSFSYEALSGCVATRSSQRRLYAFVHRRQLIDQNYFYRDLY